MFTSPCGDSSEDEGFTWIYSRIIKNPYVVRETSLNALKKAVAWIMDVEHQSYLLDKCFSSCLHVQRRVLATQKRDSLNIAIYLSVAYYQPPLQD